jgi:hypothetical protein
MSSQPPILRDARDVVRWAADIANLLHRMAVEQAAGLVVRLTHRNTALGDAPGEDGALMFDPTPGSVVVGKSDDWKELHSEDRIYTPTQSELTIATGAVTPTGFNHTVDTEGDAALDYLDTITLAADTWLLIRPANDARGIVLTENGNISVPQGDELVLNSTAETALLYCDGTNWLVLAHGGAALPTGVFSDAFSLEYA